MIKKKFLEEIEKRKNSDEVYKLYKHDPFLCDFIENLDETITDDNIINYIVDFIISSTVLRVEVSNELMVYKFNNDK